MKPERQQTTLNQFQQPIPTNGQHKPILTKNQTNPSDISPSISMTVKPLPVRTPQSKVPTLPKVEPPVARVNNQANVRQAVNPAMAIQLLQELELMVANWNKELQHILRQIQEIYLEGPMVDGWLESNSGEPEVGEGKLRNAQVENGEQVSSQPEAKINSQSLEQGYRLCGLDENGQFWSRPCPPEQVYGVSMAIARHQKLRQLLDRKLNLETRLSQLADSLVVLHQHLK